MAATEGIESSATKSRPTLDISEAGYWSAYQLLHGTRPQSGFGPSPLPLSELLAYAEYMDMVGDERHDFIHLMCALDRQYLELVRKK